jgi:cytochrome bd-type quinol oxidase subunit 2
MCRAVTITLVMVAAVGSLFLGLVFWVQPKELGMNWDQVFSRFRGPGVSAVAAYSVIWAVFVSAVVAALVVATRRARVLSLSRAISTVLLALGLALPGISMPWITMDFAISHVDPDRTGRLGFIPVTIIGVGVVILIVGIVLWYESGSGGRETGLRGPEDGPNSLTSPHTRSASPRQCGTRTTPCEAGSATKLSAQPVDGAR